MKSSFTKYAIVAAGPLLGGCVLIFTNLDPANPLVTRMAAMAVWMAVWWLSETISIALTSLLPLILLPLLGISEVKVLLPQYWDKVIFLFAGGFVIAIAIERWGLHRRIALRILMAVGSRPSDILLGVMLTTFLISMWISNTATTLMMLSAVVAVIHQMEKHLQDQKQVRLFSSGLLLGLAYSASIGGMATLVGTPTNMIFYGKYTQLYPGSPDMNFSKWFIMALPLAIVFTGLAFLVLKWMFIRNNKKGVGKQYFRDEYNKLGPMAKEEKTVGILFVTTACCGLHGEISGLIHLPSGAGPTFFRNRNGCTTVRWPL